VDPHDFTLRMGLLTDFDALTALEYFDASQLDAAWELFGANLRAKHPSYELWPDFRGRMLRQHERSRTERQRLDMGR
jgi:hypothetical protein